VVRYTKDILKGPRFTIGEHSYGTMKVVGAAGRVVVGRFCSIADNVTAVLCGHRTDWISTYPFCSAGSDWAPPGAIKGHPCSMGDLIVGHDVWIGCGATLMGGVNVGHGAVIGAGAVVCRDVPPYAVAVGNPVSVSHIRFCAEDVAFLLDLAWWDWPVDQVRKHARILCSGDLDALRALAKPRRKKKAPAAP
jgi:acetyltransferase-like isoleucine patch superfamily enzyme